MSQTKTGVSRSKTPATKRANEGKNTNGKRSRSPEFNVPAERTSHAAAHTKNTTPEIAILLAFCCTIVEQFTRNSHPDNNNTLNGITVSPTDGRSQINDAVTQSGAQAIKDSPRTISQFLERIEILNATEEIVLFAIRCRVKYLVEIISSRIRGKKKGLWRILCGISKAAAVQMAANITNASIQLRTRFGMVSSPL
jgi:hypothetical protein